MWRILRCCIFIGIRFDRRNASRRRRRIRLFVSDAAGGRAISLQVESARDATKRDKDEGKIYLWRMSVSAIERDDENLWYAFAPLKKRPSEEPLPKILFVPSKIVVKCLKRCKKDGDSWLYFWIRASQAKKYMGYEGVKPLIDSLGA